MKRRRALPGARVLAAAGALALLGLGAGAVVPDTASADGSSGGGSSNYCSPGVKSTTTVAGVLIQTCTITASSGVCIQRSSAPKVVQRCTFTQTSMLASEKRATAVQTHDPEGSGSGVQDGTQVIEVTQSNSSRKNSLNGSQLADQNLGSGCGDDDHDDDDGHHSLSISGPITQAQEAHQSIDGTQTATGTGRNEGEAFQSQDLCERASNRTAITQSQNVEDRENECNSSLVFFDSNACYTIDQTAANGANVSKLLQVYNLFQKARNTLAGNQAQGSTANPFNGGLSHGFTQDNTGTAPNGTPIQASAQVERMTQRRDDTGTMTWSQAGPLRKDVGQQSGDDGAKAIIFQDSVLSSTGGGVGAQTDVLEIECNSSGNCTGFQHARTNDDEVTNGPFTASSISMEVECGDPYVPEEYGEVSPECVAFGPGGD